MTHIHFIAIGGAVMHNLAIALKLKGYHITGSDDEIFDPAYSKLQKHNLLPSQTGWQADNIHSGIDAIILGMHAKSDNPELIKAQQLNIPIYSFPEFIYEQSKTKKRIVIGGSHGKTTTTAMIMHVLGFMNLDFDYLVGAQLQGYELTVKLSEHAPLIIIEGDEYPDSALTKTPKFHIYKADIGVITGIAWDHVNVFPTFELYKEQFKLFAEMIPTTGKLIYNATDDTLKDLIKHSHIHSKAIGYELPFYKITDNQVVIEHSGIEYPLEVFGQHNLLNLMAAWNVCNDIGVNDVDFLTAIQSFTGAAKRLELVAENDTTAFYKDFAHSPSKLKATINAMREKYPRRKLIACMELHTYSSLNKNFLHEYKGCMANADERIVYYNQHTIELKRLENISPEEVKSYFADEDLIVITDKNEIRKRLLSKNWNQTNLLLMSSGNFDGLDLNELSTFVVNEPKHV
jgi:UDP-N-acetylmuramate: L-alanyl-gamma-D-glutamyl-meso-diaminopimelate ligase